MNVQALLFDVFGTCVDWYGGISRALGAALDSAPDDRRIAGLTLAWRQAYSDGIAAVNSGQAPWRRVDGILSDGLTRLIPEYGFDRPGPDQVDRINLAWRQHDPWPDTVAGLRRLRRHHRVATLSNGNLDLLIDLSEYGGLPWDRYFCADTFYRYKPDPSTYLGACRLLDLAPDQVLLAACHRGDLLAAASHGLRTAFIDRPGEYGGRMPADRAALHEFDLVCSAITELADHLETARHERAQLV